MNSFERRKAAVAKSFRKLADDGFASREDMEKAVAELDRTDAATMAQLYRDHVTEAR